MRILFIVPYVPTPIRVRPYNLIRHLREGGHQVTLATLWSDEAERAALESWRGEGYRVVAAPLPRWRTLVNCLSALPGHRPLQAAYCWSAQLARLVDKELTAERYDLAHVEHLRGAAYGLALRGRLPVVWDSVDCISYLFEQAAQHSQSPASRLLARFDLARTRRYEGWLAQRFDRVLVTSPVDRAALGSLAENMEAEKITVLTNGVDLDYFRPGDAARDPATLILSGKMSYHANVTAALYFCREILPLIWAKRPDVRLQIVGSQPSRAVQKLASDPRIAVTGYVPDIAAYLRRATVAVAPVAYGAGIQNKVLEAMACGTPVVATTQACSALQVANGQELFIADEPEVFAGCVLQLLHDAALRERLTRQGRRYVERCHDWREKALQLEYIYGDVLSGRANS